MINEYLCKIFYVWPHQTCHKINFVKAMKFDITSSKETIPINTLSALIYFDYLWRAKCVRILVKNQSTESTDGNDVL